ncbi:MAG: hypothetical protein GY729_18400, partial [Desulfobacteraceae bacterium]|nr:hypothetical protein [Desulfobacteraceae bacterium]
QDLTWFILSVVDVYAMTEANLDQQRFTKMKRIGTPHGNEHFFSALYKIPIECFYTSHLKNLLRMLEKGRLEMIIFARASTMTMVKKLKISKVYYRKLDSIPAGFAVRLDKNGTQLKTKLDGLIQKVDHHKIFKDYNHYLQLPDKGIVTLTK